MTKGKLFVLEGLDGSGKSTQFELLDRYLSDKNVVHKSISFPNYDNPSSALVKMYLNGDFSKNASDINAYAASSFYAVDRYASYKLFWENNYKNSSFILAARYVTSNSIYQMVKLPKEEWNDYLNWLEEYEYTRLGLPKPDTVVFLDMPIEISQRLLHNRYDGDENKKDIHEINVDFLKKCREAALFTAEKHKWIVIPCSDGKNAYSIDYISDQLIVQLNKLL